MLRLRQPSGRTPSAGRMLAQLNITICRHNTALPSSAAKEHDTLWSLVSASNHDTRDKMALDPNLQTGTSPAVPPSLCSSPFGR
jgi:hypothetical protein